MARDFVVMAKAMLRAEMVRRGVSYKALVERLAAHDVVETEANLRNKISRGGFTAAFFLQCLYAMEVKNLQIDPF